MQPPAAWRPTGAALTLGAAAAAAAQAEVAGEAACRFLAALGRSCCCRPRYWMGLPLLLRLDGRRPRRAQAVAEHQPPATAELSLGYALQVTLSCCRSFPARDPNGNNNAVTACRLLG